MKTLLVFLGLSLNVGFCAQQNTCNNVAVIAALSPADKAKISFAIDTTAANQLLASKTEAIYKLQRLNSNNYHITLELLAPKQGPSFTRADVIGIDTILKNFKKHAIKLNSTPNKIYKANGYEILLFVHYTDKTSETFNKNTIQNLATSSKEVSYANLVLKIGTQGQLRDDWNDVRTNILKNPPHDTIYERISKHDLETHVTIANIFKYDSSIYTVQNKKVVNSKDPAKKVYNIPFKGITELQLLVDMFNSVKVNLPQLKGMTIDRLLMTTKNKQTQQFQTIRTMILNQ